MRFDWIESHWIYLRHQNGACCVMWDPYSSVKWNRPLALQDLYLNSLHLCHNGLSACKSSIRLLEQVEMVESCITINFEFPIVKWWILYISCRNFLWYDHLCFFCTCYHIEELYVFKLFRLIENQLIVIEYLARASAISILAGIGCIYYMV